MAGIDRDTPIPSEIKLHQKSRRLELIYEGGEAYTLDFEYLRVYTPSAEARGHGPGQETLQTGKRNVVIERIEPVGTYALRLVFFGRSRQRPVLLGHAIQPRQAPRPALGRVY